MLGRVTWTEIGEKLFHVDTEKELNAAVDNVFIIIALFIVVFSAITAVIVFISLTRLQSREIKQARERTRQKRILRQERRKQQEALYEEYRKNRRHMTDEKEQKQNQENTEED